MVRYSSSKPCSYSFFYILAMGVVACGGDPVSPTNQPDIGMGNERLDAAAKIDATEVLDAQTRDDAGEVDAGTLSPDAGLRLDAMAPPPKPVCGDGRRDPLEACDDGNTRDGDGCKSDCSGVCSASSSTVSYAVQDNFNRADSTGLGTSAISEHHWIKSDTATSSYAMIRNQSLSLHYFREQSQPRQAVALAGFNEDDMLVDVTIDPDDQYFRNVGLSYRLQSVPGFGYGNGASSGYHLNINKDGLSLKVGRREIGAAAMMIDAAPHDYRVVTNGDTHCVYYDGNLVIEAEDDTYKRGYVGVYGSYAIMSVDDFGIHAIESGNSSAPVYDVFDNFERSDSPRLQSTAVGAYQWLESGDPGSEHIAIQNGHLALRRTANNQTQAVQTARIENFNPRDFELTVLAERSNTDSTAVGAYGVSYRVVNISGGINTQGYHLRITDGSLMLYAGAVSIAQAPWPLSSRGKHHYRIAVVGPSHQVFVDGALALEAFDAQFANGGSIGVFGDNAAIDFDDLSVRIIDGPPVIYPAKPGEDAASAEFPIGLYSVAAARIPEVLAQGFNVVHTYGFEENWYAAGGRRSVQAMAPVGTYRPNDQNPVPLSLEAPTRTQIETMSSYAHLRCWDYPEELRYWRANEVQEMQNLRNWTRAYDPTQAPTFMYQPNHRTAEALAETVPYVDIIAAGGYVGLSGQSRPWIRYRVQSLIDAIQMAGYTVGDDYLNNERIPMLVAGIFSGNATNANEAYHDVYCGIAQGAKGVLVYSLFHGLKDDTGDGLAGFAKAARELTKGPNPLGPIILRGTPYTGATVSITSGMTMTDAFTPAGLSTPITYPSVAIFVRDMQGKRTMIAVNSREDPVTARFEGLGSANGVKVRFEDRNLVMTGGSFSDTFAPLAVHIYEWDL